MKQKSDLTVFFQENIGKLPDDEMINQASEQFSRPIYNIKESLRKFKYRVRRSGVSQVARQQQLSVQYSMPSVIPKGLSKEQLRSKYDVGLIIQKKLSELIPDNFITETEFIRFCGLKGVVGYRMILDSELTIPFKGKAGGIIYYSHPDSIQEEKMNGTLK